MEQYKIFIVIRIAVVKTTSPVFKGTKKNTLTNIFSKLNFAITYYINIKLNNWDNIRSRRYYMKILRIQGIASLRENRGNIIKALEIFNILLNLILQSYS